MKNLWIILKVSFFLLFNELFASSNSAPPIYKEGDKEPMEMSPLIEELPPEIMDTIFSHLSCEEYLNYLPAARLFRQLPQMTLYGEKQLFKQQLLLLESLNFGNEDQKSQHIATTRSIRRIVRFLFCKYLPKGILKAEPSLLAKSIIKFMKDHADLESDIQAYLISSFTSLPNFSQVFPFFSAKWIKYHIKPLLFGLAFNGNAKLLGQLVTQIGTMKGHERRDVAKILAMGVVLGENAEALRIIDQCLDYKNWSQIIKTTCFKCDKDRFIGSIRKYLSSDYFFTAIKYGSQHLIGELLKANEEEGSLIPLGDCLESCLVNNNIKILQYFLSGDSPQTAVFRDDYNLHRKLFFEACEHGKLDFVKYFTSLPDGKPLFPHLLTERSIPALFNPSNVKMFLYAFELLRSHPYVKPFQHCFSFDHRFLRYVAQSGNYGLLRFIYEAKLSSHPCFENLDFAHHDSKHVIIASVNGNLEFLRFYTEKLQEGSPLFAQVRLDTVFHKNDIVSAACEGGHVDVLKFIYQRKLHKDAFFQNISLCSPVGIRKAIKSRHLHILKFFWKGCQRNDPLFDKASFNVPNLEKRVANSSVQILNFFYEVKKNEVAFPYFNFSKKMIVQAAKNFSLSEFMFYYQKLLERDSVFEGISLPPNLLKHVVKEDSFEIFEFIISCIEKGKHPVVHLTVDIEKLLLTAARSGSRFCFKAIHKYMRRGHQLFSTTSISSEITRTAIRHRKTQILYYCYDRKKRGDKLFASIDIQEDSLYYAELNLDFPDITALYRNNGVQRSRRF